MGGFAAPSMLDGHGFVREASWLDLPRDQRDVAEDGPPIWAWEVPLRRSDVRIRAYRGSRDRRHPTQDELAVAEFRDRLVLAVADGVTPTDATPRVDGLDGARHAARVVLTHVCWAPGRRSLRSVFTTANATLLDTFVHRPRAGVAGRDRPQAAAAAVTLHMAPDGAVSSIDSARAADCEIAVRRHGDWLRVAPEPMFAAHIQAALQRWDTMNPTASYQDRIVHERRILNDRASWVRTSLGRFDRPKIDAPTVPMGFDELILATDGVELQTLQADAMSGPEMWLAQLRRTEAARRPHGRPHSDVALLHLWFDQAASMR